MSARLIILIVAAAGLAAALAFRGSSPPDTDVNDTVKVRPLNACDKPVSQQDVPGEEPAELPSLDDFTIDVRVDRTTVKNRLVFTVSEAHGYYVDGLDIRFWWKEDGQEIDWEESPVSFQHFMNNYIKANETFMDCITVSAPELTPLDGDMGDSSNWGAMVERYAHVRVKNPEKLPCTTSVEDHCR